MFEAKDLHLCANLSELSHSRKDLVKIASLRRESSVKVRLKYVISLIRKAKKRF